LSRCPIALIQNDKQEKGFDDNDVGDGPLFVCIRRNDTATSPPPTPLRYTFDVPQHGLMTFETLSPLSIEFAQSIFSYLGESESITFSINERQLRQSESLPTTPDTITVTYLRSFHES
jgi:hypothetical protein